MIDDKAKPLVSPPAPDATPCSLERDREDAWLAEVERRWHAVESGLEATIDHEEALAFIFSPRRAWTSP